MACDEDFGERIVARTDTYTADIEACVELVSQLFEEYLTGGDYRRTVDRIRELESDCDRHNRQLNALITNASVEEFGLRNSRVHLNLPQVTELYQAIDEIPNAAERIAEDLVTIEPPREERCFQGFLEMADCATTAVAILSEILTEFAQLLRTPSQSGTVANEIEAVRDAESSCDGIRNDVITAAFDEQPIPHALVYREFALDLDVLVDAMEDVTDQLVLVSSTESWITTELDHEQRPV
ncbi:DUF47 family protein [Natrialbaceae archaeon A-arb3/5]